MDRTAIMVGDDADCIMSRVRRRPVREQAPAEESDETFDDTELFDLHARVQRGVSARARLGS
eukprot:1087915-Rhodomonas_salina.2